MITCDKCEQEIKAGEKVWYGYDFPSIWFTVITGCTCDNCMNKDIEATRERNRNPKRGIKCKR